MTESTYRPASTPDSSSMGSVDRPRSQRLWHALYAANEGFGDIKEDLEQPRGAASSRPYEAGQHGPLSRRRARRRAEHCGEYRPLSEGGERPTTARLSMRKPKRTTAIERSSPYFHNQDLRPSQATHSGPAQTCRSITPSKAAIVSAKTDFLSICGIPLVARWTVRSKALLLPNSKASGFSSTET